MLSRWNYSVQLILISTEENRLYLIFKELTDELSTSSDFNLLSCRLTAVSLLKFESTYKFNIILDRHNVSNVSIQ